MKKIILSLMSFLSLLNNVSFGQTRLTDDRNNPIEGFGLIKHPHNNTVYFAKTDSVTRTAIYSGTLSEGKISSIKRNAIIDNKSQETIPFFSPEGKYIFLFSNFQNQNSGNLDLWFGKYNKMRMIQDLKKVAAANSDSVEYYGSMSASGDLYFSSWQKNGYGKGDIFSIKFRKGKFSSVNHLDTNINNKLINSSPAISPKGDWIIFYTENEKTNVADLCISFLKKGKWSKPAKLPDLVNTPNFEFAPVLGDGGKTLYFSRREKSNVSDKDVYHLYKISVEKLELEKLKLAAEY